MLKYRVPGIMEILKKCATLRIIKSQLVKNTGDLNFEPCQKPRFPCECIFLEGPGKDRSGALVETYHKNSRPSP